MFWIIWHNPFKEACFINLKCLITNRHRINTMSNYSIFSHRNPFTTIFFNQFVPVGFKEC